MLLKAANISDSKLHTEDKRDTAVCCRAVYFNGVVRYQLHLLFAGAFDSFNRRNFIAAILALYLKRRHGTLPVKWLHTVAVRRTRDNALRRYVHRRAPSSSLQVRITFGVRKFRWVTTEECSLCLKRNFSLRKVRNISDRTDALLWNFSDITATFAKMCVCSCRPVHMKTQPCINHCSSGHISESIIIWLILLLFRLCKCQM